MTGWTAGTLGQHGGRIDLAEALYPEAPHPWVDLSTGINPCSYPLPRLEPTLWHRLPLARDLAALESAAAAHYGQPLGWRLVPVPGSELAIRLMPRVVAARRVGILGPTYRSHADAWRAAGAAVVELDALPAPSADLDAVVVVNPNNPDGRRFAAAALLDWAAAWSAAGRWLIVDEAFADIVPEASLLTLPALPDRVIILRSLGKFFGLAGLRLGFVAAAEGVAERWASLVGDWPVSGPACAIGAAALQDAAWIAATRARLAADRQRLDELLAGAGLAVLGGTDLFRLVAVPQGLDLVDHCARRGLLLRGFDAAPHCVRVGLPGTAAAWRRLAEACASLA